MGGGRPPSSRSTVKAPKPNLAGLSKLGGGAGGGSSSGGKLKCQTFSAENVKPAAKKAKVKMPVYGILKNSTVEVFQKDLGVLGLVPARVSKIILESGNTQWAGEVIGVDVSKPSIKIILCPL